MSSIIMIMAKMGGRKFIIAILNAVLLPTLAIYLPADVVELVITAIASVSGVFIGSQAMADGMSKGKTSSTVKDDEDE